MTVLMNVKDLIEGCIHNRKNAQNMLYDIYSSRLYGVCLRYSGDRDEAQDILQESLLKIFNSIHTFKYVDEFLFYGWMYKITVNTALNHYRELIKRNQDKEAVVELSNNNEIDEYSVFDTILEHINQQTLLKLIQELPIGYRTIFNLYAFENRSHKEIAEEFNISINTSKTQLFKARKILISKINDILESNQVKKVV